MSARDHKVQRILLEIINTDQDSYKSDEDILSALVNTSFVRALEELLDEADVGEDTIRIPQLMIDLGSISRPFDSETIISAFKEQLRGQLRQQLEKSEATERTDEKSKRKKTGTEAETLIWFLENGSLPWWAETLPAAAKWNEISFRTTLIQYLFVNRNASVRRRLLKQFSSSELRIMIQYMVGESDRKAYAFIDRILETLMVSADHSRKLSAAQLLQKTLENVLAAKGRIGAPEQLLANFIAADPELQKLNLQQTAAYLGETAILEMEAIKAMKDEPGWNDEHLNKEAEKARTGLSDQEDLLLHYLVFGSFPDRLAGATQKNIQQEELAALIRELLLRSPTRLAQLLRGQESRQRTFIRILLSLPQPYFKSILNVFLRKPAYGESEEIRRELKAAVSLPAVTGELKILAAVLLVKHLTQEKRSSAAEVYAQTLPFLSGEEKKRLAKAMLKEEPDAVNEAAGSGAEAADTPDSVYFSDLLYFVLGTDTWPWWGSRYTALYGETDIEKDLPSAIGGIILHFSSLHPTPFAGFSKKLIRETEKPSALFLRLEWKVSLTILDAVLPVFRNTFSRTLEAVIRLIAQHKSMGIQAEIATQQLILSIIDKQRDRSFHFRDGINELITLITVRSGFPLWEAYSILLKHYDELDLKNPLTKAEATTLFQYHESLEEQYVKIAAMVEDRNTFSEVHSGSYRNEMHDTAALEFIGDRHESLIHEYLSGKDMAVRAFPSAWALGTFIADRLKQSPSFFETLKNNLNAGSFGSVYRLIQLEALSGTSWLADLTEKREYTALQADLQELLEGVVGVRKEQVKQILRTVFITLGYWQDEPFTITRLKAVLTAFSAESGIALPVLETAILQKLSKGTEKAAGIRALYEDPERITAALPPQEGQKTFLANLKELNYRKYAGIIKAALERTKDTSLRSQLYRELRTIRTKAELQLWVEKELDHRDKSSLLSFISNSTEPEDTGAFLSLVREQLSALPAEEKTPLPVNEAIAAVLLFVRSGTYFKDKRRLLSFLESKEDPKAGQVISFIEKLEEFPDKKALLEFISKEFSIIAPGTDQEEETMDHAQLVVLRGRIENIKDTPTRKTLLDFIKSNNRISRDELTAFITGLTFAEKQQVLDFVPETKMRSGVSRNETEEGNPGADKAQLSVPLVKLITFVQGFADFPAKEKFISFIQAHPAATKADLVAYIKGNKLVSPQLLLDLIEGEFPQTTADVASRIAILKQGKAPHIQRFLSAVGMINSHTTQRTLLNFISLRFSAAAAQFFSFIDPLPDFPEKEDLLKLIRNEFPEGDAWMPETERRLKFWKDKPGPGVPSPEGEERTSVAQVKKISDNTGTKQDKKNLSQNSSGPVDLNPEEETQNTDQGVPPQLSHEAVADIALYYFFNGELPWWSAVKELADLEKMVWHTAIAAPFILAKKLNDIAESEQEFFMKLANELNNTFISGPQAGMQQSTGTSEDLYQEQLAETINLHTSWLKVNIPQQERTQHIEELAEELRRQLKQMNLDRGQLEGIIVGSLARALNVIDPAGVDRIRQMQPETELSATEDTKRIVPAWKDTLEAIVAEREQTGRRFYPFRLALRETEQALSQNKGRASVAVTDRLFFLPDIKEDTGEEIILKTWLHMMKAGYDISLEQLHAGIEERKRALTPANHATKEMLESLLVLQTGENDFLLPYSGYVSALDLVLAAADEIGHADSTAALLLFTGLARMQELPDRLSLSLSLLFRYLKEKGLEKERFIQLAESISNTTGNSAIIQSIGTLVERAKGNSATASYSNEIFAEQEKTTTSVNAPEPERIESATQAVEVIITKFRSRQPVFQQLETKKKEEQELLRKERNRMQQADLPKERIDIDLNGHLYIPNAGLIILWPFFTRLFTNLKYMEQGKFTDAEKQQRAIHLTQYLVGFTEDHPEYTLMLNKLICGVELTEPAERTVSLTEEEKSEARNLLNAVLAQWKEMSNTSPENFQRTFIQREGLMYQKDGNWYIKVTRTAFDVLLLRLPWGLSIIKYPWNNYLIFVEWKAMN